MSVWYSPEWDELFLFNGKKYLKQILPGLYFEMEDCASGYDTQVIYIGEFD